MDVHQTKGTYRDGSLAASGPASSEEETSWLKKEKVRRGKRMKKEVCE